MGGGINIVKKRYEMKWLSSVRDFGLDSVGISFYFNYIPDSHKGR